MAAGHVAAVVLVDPVVQIGTPSTAPTGPSTPLLKPFATLEEAERHFRETEEGEWAGGTVGRFVQDIMMHDSESGTWRFPYTPARLHRLRAFTASPASDYSLFAKVRAAARALSRACVSRRYEQALSVACRATFPSGICIRT